MLNVNIVYNPYFVETSIEVNGKAVEAGTPLWQLCQHERLQNWIDKFFPLLKEEYREKKFAFKFRGMVQDSEDFKDALNQFCNVQSDVQATVDVDSKGLKTDRMTSLKELFESGKKDDAPFADLFKSQEMQAAFDRAVDPTFEANVIATMSSGKSTVVNSLLGMDLMPAKNEACTATIARITDDDHAQNFMAQRFNSDNEPISEFVKIDNETLTKWNDDPATSRIEIVGNIPTVDETPDCRMVFVDTPGPNNSRNEDHKRATYEAIQSKPLSMVLYVLNSTQLSTNDDQQLLNKVCEVMHEGGRKAQDRFVFIANKIDAFDPASGESVTKALKNVRDYLAGFGIEHPLVIPASAYLAKLLRKKKGGYELTRKERGDLQTLVDLFVEEPEMNMLNHVKDRISYDCHRRLEKRLASAKSPEEKAEILSGIPIVEELLNDFLQKHALPAKLKDAVDSLEKVMMAAKIAEKKEEQLAKGEADRTELLARIKAFNEDKKRIEQGEKFREEVRGLKYKESISTRNKVNAINAKKEKLCKDIAEGLEGDDDVKPNEARRITRMVLSRCRDMDADVIVSLETALQEEQMEVLKGLRGKYQAFVEKELKKSFPADSAAAELQACVMQMPSVEEMIASNQTTKRVCVGSHKVRTSKWYKPWTWGSSKTVRDYENVDVVDVEAIAAELCDSVRKATMTHIDEFRAQAANVLEEAKKQVLAVMDEIDNKVKAIQKDLEAANKDKSKLDAQLAECRKQIEWINSFKKNLAEILSV